MLKVTAWTVGLFGAGAAISRAFDARWLEPVVLVALGLAFLFVSARAGRPAAPAKLPEAELPRAAAARVPAPARIAPAAAAQASAASRVPVEQSASV